MSLPEDRHEARHRRFPAAGCLQCARALVRRFHPASRAPVATTPAPAAAPMARAPDQENYGSAAWVFRAFGTEPFWNVNVEDATPDLHHAEDQAGMVMQGERHSVTGGVEIAGSHAGKSFT